MKLQLAVCATLLCAVRAEGNNALLTPIATSVLTSIDELPTKATLAEAFSSAEGLRQIALDSSVELGIQLRAIRALPTMCPDAPEACPTAHDTLVAIIAAEHGDPRAPTSTLRLRAAIEAFGALRSGVAADADVVGAFLGDRTPTPALQGDPSRDIRTAAARALRGMCSALAEDRLTRGLSGENNPQVRKEIQSSLTAIKACVP